MPAYQAAIMVIVKIASFILGQQSIDSFSNCYVHTRMHNGEERMAVRGEGLCYSTY